LWCVFRKFIFPKGASKNLPQTGCGGSVGLGSVGAFLNPLPPPLIIILCRVSSPRQQCPGSCSQASSSRAAVPRQQFQASSTQQKVTNGRFSAKMADYVCWVRFFFFENVFCPHGAQKNSQKWVCLAGKILVSLPPILLPLYKTPPTPIKHKIRK